MSMREYLSRRVADEALASLIRPPQSNREHMS